MYVLFSLVLFFQGSLHVEVELSFALDTLLLHVSYDTFMHGLEMGL